MKKYAHTINMKELLGPAVGAFPEPYHLPPEAVIRLSYQEHIPELKEGSSHIETLMHGYGILEWRGRNYTFKPAPEYRDALNLPGTFSGHWA